MIIQTLVEFQKWAESFHLKLACKTIFLLRGPLGAGKTEFVKALVKALGGETVASPTFALHHQYAIKEFKTSLEFIDHWDLYRLENEDDLESSGFWDLFQKPAYCVFIEWPERISEGWLPQDATIVKIEIEFENEVTRRVGVKTIKPPV